MSGYEWPYTKEAVSSFKEDARWIAERLHDPYAYTDQFYLRDVKVLEAMLYDAMVALRERMINGEGF